MPRPAQPSSSPASPIASFAAFLASEHAAVEWRAASPPGPSGPSGPAKGVWSEDEHARFLDALKQFPHGPWKAITAHVGTRSIRQVQTHAQKYMEKVQRRARGLKTAQPRLVRRDHKIDEAVEAWWKREHGMLAGSPSRPKPTSRRQRQHRRQDSSDTTSSTTSSIEATTRDAFVAATAEDSMEDEDDDGLDFEPLPLCDELAPTSPLLPTLEECLVVVSECLVEPMASLHLQRNAIV